MLCSFSTLILSFLVIVPSLAVPISTPELLEERQVSDGTEIHNFSHQFALRSLEYLDLLDRDLQQLEELAQRDPGFLNSVGNAFSKIASPTGLQTVAKVAGQVSNLARKASRVQGRDVEDLLERDDEFDELD
ncbi:hypothetical protein NLJ89_g10244 [Agrocybe chaxingu]|uniref:Uncharacterized protein n=1 Tax=Agrocybe chaxingu TaxID=84603 RepID=A0A9W8JUI6_9AGAR|nr:hypothetical protein NLJ89_g10244 [Agrocybe chaxingu]